MEILSQRSLFLMVHCYKICNGLTVICIDNSSSSSEKTISFSRQRFFFGGGARLYWPYWIRIRSTDDRLKPDPVRHTYYRMAWGLSFCWWNNRCKDHWRKAGSGTVSQRYGSEDPDPYQNVTDPERWFVWSRNLIDRHKGLSCARSIQPRKEQHAP